VEDSPDNQLLIKAYLKDSPYELIFEEDGKSAVDRAAVSDFDLILMDVLLPVMNGLEATRAIHAFEVRRGSPPTPVIALTAHASSQDVARSAGAGCAAHLSKPVSKHELLSTIEKHRRQPFHEEISQSQQLEHSRIRIHPGLENIVPGYLANRRKEFPEMLALLAASDYARLGVLAHNLNGTGKGYGFPELTRMGAALERSAKQTDRDALCGQMTELGNYLDHVELIGST